MLSFFGIYGSGRWEKSTNSMIVNTSCPLSFYNEEAMNTAVQLCVSVANCPKGTKTRVSFRICKFLADFHEPTVYKMRELHGLLEGQFCLFEFDHLEAVNHRGCSGALPLCALYTIKTYG
jgi:hypothetical protein